MSDSAGLLMLLSIGLMIVLIVWTIVRAVRVTMKSVGVVQRRLASVLSALREGRTPLPDEIRALAADASTRLPLYHALRQAGRLDLFPPEYATPAALVEEDEN